MIDVQHLTYTYPNTETPALNDITFSVKEGECLGILGLNGAGKSSLCYAIMGLIPHFYHGTISGDVWVDGINVPDASIAEMSSRVGLVFQNPYNQLSGAKLTVRDELAFGLENLGIERKEMLKRIDWVTELFRLEQLLDRNPYQLSGGQMQRVAIASVLVMKPKILVLDEPTSQLDPAGTEDVFECLSTLRNEGATILLVEHKIDLITQYCDSIAVLSEGELRLFGTPQEVFSNPLIAETGVEAPLYTRAYQAVVGSAFRDHLPVTLQETIERFKEYEKNRS